MTRIAVFTDIHADLPLFGGAVGMVHYMLNGEGWLPIKNKPTVAEFDEMFARLEADVILHGHHPPSRM